MSFVFQFLIFKESKILLKPILDRFKIYQLFSVTYLIPNKYLVYIEVPSKTEILFSQILFWLLLISHKSSLKLAKHDNEIEC